MPEIETPGRRVLGHARASSRKRMFLVFTKTEIEAVISRLPEYTTSKQSGSGSRCVRALRSRGKAACDLQPSPKLSVPENYRIGASALTITEETDKSRFGRELPLSVNARKALDSVCPAKGVIFGRHDFRKLLRDAACEAGIDAHRASRSRTTIFAHSRLTPPGTGHKQPLWCHVPGRPQAACHYSRYMRPPESSG